MKNQCPNTTGARQGCAETHVHFLQARRLPTLLLLFCCLSVCGFDSSAQTPAGRVVSWGIGACQPNIPPGTVFTNVLCAWNYAIGITREGRPVVWGGFHGSINPPAGLSNVTAVAIQSAGLYTSFLALRNNGTVASWGYNPASSLPAGLTGISAIAGGMNHVLALRSNGTVVAWGNNQFGQA